MNVLKNLRVIYWCALDHKKWSIALQVLELQAKYGNLFEKQHLLPQCPPVVTREQQRSGVISKGEKLGLALKHPPPAPAEHL